MLTIAVIEPATSELVAPVVRAPSKDGSLQFCVDYRRLNAVTAHGSYPIPRMDECIDSFGDTQVFSTLDCNAGYWQIEVEKTKIKRPLLPITDYSDLRECLSVYATHRVHSTTTTPAAKSN